MTAFIEPLLCVSLLYLVGIDSAILSENALPEISRDLDSERSSKDIKNIYIWKNPFVAYWNVPSYDCPHVFNVDLQLDKFGITANTGQNFTGDKIVIFYQDELGYYPHFNHSDLQPINGGLPQVGDISAHLEKATADILKAIPDPQFKGIGIIDWESWRPQWEQNFDARQIYRKKSIELVYNKHPAWTNETIELVATVEYEQAAENWMESTLRLAKNLRPNARWGFYHFPYCHNEKDPAHCTQEAILTNDNITWLFDSSTALYPSIYMKESQETKNDFVHAKVAEAFRLRNKSRNPFVDVYPYTRYVYRHSEVFLTKKVLNDTVLQSAQMGSSGVVFWGSDNDTHTAESCLDLQSYINSTLGPYVKKLIDATVICSAEICSGNGRCVGKILECAGLLKRKERTNELDVKMRDGYERWQQTLMPCSCQCYKGWKGISCDKFEY